MATDVHILSNNLNGGEMSPLMEARVDSDKFKSGARLLENFIVDPHGGITKRPGTEYLGETVGSVASRLEGFRRSVNQNYILEFTPGNIRVWKAGASAGRVEIDYGTDTTLYEWNVWVDTTTYAVGEKVYKADTGKFYICTKGHVAASATNEPEVGSDWSDNWDYFTYELHTLVHVLDYLGAATIYKCKLSHSKYVAPGVTNTTYWQQLNGAYVDIITPYTSDELFDIQAVQLNDVMFLAHENHHPKRLSRISEIDWQLEDVPFQYPPTSDVNNTVATVQVQFNEPDWDAPVWALSTTYYVGDRVKRGTAPLNFYVCKATHTSVALNEPSVGMLWANNWDIDTYAIGDRVINSSGIIYTVHTAHTPSNSTTSALGQPGITSGSWVTYWNEGTSSQKIADWVNATNYQVGNKMKKNKVIYDCIVAHKSANPSSTRYGLVGGNVPTGGAYWTKYWRVSNAGTDLRDIEYKMLSTDDVFVSTDVGTSWQISTGSLNYYMDIDISAGTTIGPTEEFFIQGGYLVSTNWDSGSAMVGTLTLEESTDGVTWETIKQWVTSHVNQGNISHSGEAPTTGAWYRLSAARTSGGQRVFKIEPTNSVLKLPFKITEYISAKEVRGYYVMPNDQLPPINIIGISTTNYRKPAFSPTTGYPRTVTFHESRIWWAGTTTEPSRIWASQKEDFYIFLLGTEDTSALDLQLASVTINKIMWIKSYNKTLVVGTEGELFTVDSGESDASISASNIRARLRINIGTCSIPPVQTGDALLFFQRGKKRLREFAYNFQSDSFTAPDMTLLAEHINQQGFIQSAFQSNLTPILWNVTNDGGLAGFSYDREQGITAWHRHFTGDRVTFYLRSQHPSGDSNDFYADMFTSVATVFGGDSPVDEVWFNVTRYVGGIYYNYIERFSTASSLFNQNGPGTGSWNYMDSYKRLLTRTVLASPVRTQYSNSAAHLYNRSVQVLEDNGTNYTETEYVVGSGGTVTRTGDDGLGSKRITVGIPIFSIMSPTRLEIPLQNGTSQGRNFRINRVSFKLWRSFGGKWKTYKGVFSDAAYAQNSFEILPSKDDVFTAIDYNEFSYTLSNDFPRMATTLGPSYHTGQTSDQSVNSDSSEDVIFVLVHRDPRPFTMLGAIYKLQISGN